MDKLSSDSRISAIALTSDAYEYLILTDSTDEYFASDAWAADFDLHLREPEELGGLMMRKGNLAGAGVTFLFGRATWAKIDPIDPDTEKLARSGLFAVHDPKGLIRALQEFCTPNMIRFADDFQWTK